MIENISEVSLNVTLASLLCRHGLKALGETIISRPKRNQPDIIISVNNFRIAIEGKKDHRKLKEAIKQCEERIDQGIADLCIALVYKYEYKRRDLIDYIQFVPVSQSDIEELLITSLKYDVVLVTYVDRILMRNTLLKFFDKSSYYQNLGRYIEYKDLSFDDLFRIIIQSYEFIISMDLIDELIKVINAKLNLLKELSGNKSVVERLAKVLELERK